MIIFNPGILSSVSDINPTSVISISTQQSQELEERVKKVVFLPSSNIQNQSSLSLQNFFKSPPANSKGTLSNISPTTTHFTSATTYRNDLLIASKDTDKCGPGTPRDKYTQPFACLSIWNMPIGSGANYVGVYIGSRAVYVDTDWFVTSKESDPAVPTYMIPTWGEGRCTGTIPQQQAQWHPAAASPLKIPYDFIIPDAKGGWTPNNSSAFLKPDGKTLVEFNGTARCQQGGPLYGNWFGEHDIYGDGISGGHGGSGMSSIGGSIRKGELLNDEPIRHALKIVIWGQWLHYDPEEPTPGRRWPANLADSYASSQYKGSNPALVMGSLLAIPPNVTADSLGLTTKAGRKLFAAMQDYGAYVVDDSGWDYNYFAVEHNAEMEYQAVTGNHLNNDAALQADFAKIIAAVKVVDNNGPDSIGGGGTPRQPLAPAIGN